MPSDGAFGRLLSPGDYSEESRFTAAVAAKYGPAVAFADGERDFLEDSRRAKLDTDVRQGDLGQVERVAVQAERHPSSDSTVWSPMWPILKVELLSFPYPLLTIIPRPATSRVKPSAGRSPGSLIAEIVGD